MDTSCCQGDLIAVLKKQDPMGNKERWFVNNGCKLEISFVKKIFNYLECLNKQKVMKNCFLKHSGNRFSSSINIEAKHCDQSQ